MKKSRNLSLLLFILTFISIINLNKQYIAVQGQTEGNFRLDQINWQSGRYPGATNVPLQFQITNLHNQTITSIFGELSLSFPFTDNVDGDTNANSVGEALSVYFNVSQYAVVEGDPFELVFNLDIDENALKGLYSANLTINYFIRSGGLTPGTPTIFKLELNIPNSPPQVSWIRPTVGTLIVDLNEVINFSVICYDEDNDSLVYFWEVNNHPQDNINESSFLFTAQFQVGVQEITLFVSDGETSISRSWLVETQIHSETHLSTDTQYLQAGTTTDINVNITNNLWNGIVEIQLQDPAPLIIQGEASWTFTNISEGFILSFPIKIFTPLTSMGATGAAVFLVSYNDQYGINYNEVVTIGLIIRGIIQVSLFSSEISDTTVNQGETVTISATLLNTGNTNALFTNTSILIEEGILIESSNSKSYLGELEPDSPLPFSISVEINDSAEIGEYLIICVICYQDDLYLVHKITINFSINIIAKTDTTGLNSGLNLDAFAFGSGVAIILGGSTVLAVAIAINRKRQ
jgi:hypothetical protein